MSDLIKNLESYIVLYAPVIIAVLSEVIVFFSTIKKCSSYFSDSKAKLKELEESIEYKQLKKQLQCLLDDNKDLRMKLDVLVTRKELDKVVNHVNSNKKV